MVIDAALGLIHFQVARRFLSHSYTTGFWWAAGMFAAGSVLAAPLFRRGAPAAPTAEEAPTS